MSGDELETGIIIENIIVFIFGISIILGFWIIYKVSNELINSVNTINQAFEDIMHKNIGKVEYTGNIIELNILVEKLSETNKFFLDIRDFIANLANNKFDNNKFSLRNDFLSLELEKMRIKLIANEEMLKEQQTDTNQRDWINSGLSKFNEILRLYSGNLNELSSQLITSLVKYLNAIQGGIFISNDDQYEQLDLFASFAFNRKKYLQKTIKFGDGLVGTAVLEKRTIYLTELPADYLEISSGLGDTLPVALLIVPLIRDNEVYGALEISSFKTFSKTEIEFVEKVAELTGLTINTEKINQKTIRLLAESQRKSDELATQEEEMRQNLEELRAVQEESKKAQDRLQKTIDSIDQKLLKIELKPDKLVIDLNKRFLEISKMNLALLKGKNIEEIIALESVAEFKLSWQAAIEGKKSDIRIKFNIINNDFYGVLVPIFDIDSGHLTEMILFLSDMSDLTKQFNELNRKIEQGGKQISNFENDLKHTEQNAKSQKVISEQIFNLWTKHLALAQNEKEQKLELNKAILKLEEKTKVIVDKNTQLKQQLGQIIQNKSDNAELDNLYKDWLDNIEE
jgi:GAF domain-containing protein